MQIQPTRNLILIRMHELEEDTGLVLPESVQLNPYGEVLRVGPDCTTSAVGDRVIFLPNNILAGFKQPDFDVFLLNEDCVIGKYIENHLA